MGTSTNSEDPDEMQHQGLHCLLMLKRSSDKKKYNIFSCITCMTPLDLYNGLPQVKKEESISIQRVKQACQLPAIKWDFNVQFLVSAFISF